MIKSTCHKCFQEFTHNGTEQLCSTCRALSPALEELEATKESLAEVQDELIDRNIALDDAEKSLASAVSDFNEAELKICDLEGQI